MLQFFKIFLILITFTSPALAQSVGRDSTTSPSWQGYGLGTQCSPNQVWDWDRLRCRNGPSFCAPRNETSQMPCPDGKFGFNYFQRTISCPSGASGTPQVTAWIFTHSDCN